MNATIFLMRHWWLIILIGLWLAAAPATHSVDADVQYLIRFKALDLKAAQADRWADTRNLRVITRLSRIDVWVLQPIDPRRPIELADLARDPAVAWAELNGEVYAHTLAPNDYWYAPKQAPYFELLGLPAAWDWTRGSTQPIAFVDTGVDLTHPDLINKLWQNPAETPGNDLDDDGNGYIDDVTGWNFVNNNNQPHSTSTHGSHVAGIAAADTNNGQGVAGVSWQARIMPLRALADNNTGTITNTAAAIIYAADNGARIINLSLGTTMPSNTLAQAVSYAQSKGCLLIASAGNDGFPSIEYPAALPGVMAVGASTPSDARWSNSNYGPEIDVVAPGVQIFSTARYQDYALLDGTSMSTAFVSGLADLIWSLQPAWTADEVAHTIASTAHDIAAPGWDAYTGWGRIDAYRAVQRAATRNWFFPVIAR